MFAGEPGRKITAYVPDYVVFDLETTGISCADDQVIEISAVKVRGGQVVDEFTSLVNPGRPIPLQASAVNGIYDHMVKNSPSFMTVLDEFLAFIGDDVLVGHNIAGFDLKFITRDAIRYFGMAIGNDYLDTLPYAKRRLPKLAHHRLTDLAQHYGISSEGAHRALNDCRMNQKVFELLAKEKESAPSAPDGVRICPRCGMELKRRSGRFGEFWGCTGYPSCRYTENIR